jgi:hypothetical protein
MDGSGLTAPGVQSHWWGAYKWTGHRYRPFSHERSLGIEWHHNFQTICTH